MAKAVDRRWPLKAQGQAGGTRPVLGLFTSRCSSAWEDDRLADRIAAEHRGGRPLAEILEDPWIRAHCSGERIRRLLERPDLSRALAYDTALSLLPLLE
jgi:hypothetical protein